MTPAHALGQLLPLLAPGLTAAAGGAVMAGGARWLASGLIALAFLADLTLSLAAPALNATLEGTEATLFTWSPLGLYGESVLVQRGAHVALVTCPVLVLAWLGMTLGERRRRWFSGLAAEPAAARASGAAALLALAGCLWAVRAGDFVSLFFGVSLGLLGTSAVLATTAGIAVAGRRLVLGQIALAALLTSGLVLGKVNGHFQLSGLSTAGFTDVAFFGLSAAAAVLAAVPPFHGWLLRSSRSALAPALATAGLACATVLLLTALLATELKFSWQGQLRALGWLAAILGCGVSLARRRPVLSLAAAWVARAGTLFLAASVSTPASFAAALAFAAVPMASHGVLWLTAAIPWGGHVRARGSSAPPLRTPGFWINLLLLATAVGLPPTLGGTLRSALAGALTSWPSGDQLLRVPLVLTDVTTLIAGSALLWEPRYLPPVRGARGWMAAGALGLALVVPALAPQFLVSPWLDPAAAAAVRTSASPLHFSGPVLPSVPGAVLFLLGAWALMQRLRGREWLPPLALTLLGALALAWGGTRRRWRRRGLNRATAAFASAAWNQAERGAERLLMLLRPFEERYYAGTAILLAVAIIFVVGR